jgi:hypothetical protein
MVGIHKETNVKRASVVLALIGLMTSVCLPARMEGRQPSAPGEAKKAQRNLAILIFEGVQIIDYRGPYETFGHVYSFDQSAPFNIYTVA